MISGLRAHLEVAVLGRISVRGLGAGHATDVVEALGGSPSGGGASGRSAHGGRALLLARGRWRA